MMFDINAFPRQQMIVGASENRDFVTTLSANRLLYRLLGIALVGAFIAFINAYLDTRRHFGDHSRSTQECQITEAAGQAPKDMQDLLFCRDNLGLDGMILLLATVALFAFLFVLWLRNRLLGRVNKDFLNLRIGLKQFFERVDATFLLAGRGRLLLVLLGGIACQMAQRRIAQGSG